ncbi:hypothetical protein AGMMS49990_10720 [Endomicrobiia bacterium]|nr:hypothetical protein AGMMS49990_10720 [Endomicrobiia bacterium]
MANRLDVSSAAETLALATKPVLDKSKVPQKTISVRINEIDYNRLNSLFVAQGTNLSAAGRAAIFFLAEQVESGKLTIPNGVIYRRNV